MIVAIRTKFMFMFMRYIKKLCSVVLQKAHTPALSAGGLVTGAVIHPELLWEIHECQRINKMK
jgi:hypothetical protein